MLFEGVKKRALRSLKPGCNIKEEMALKGDCSFDELQNRLIIICKSCIPLLFQQSLRAYNTLRLYEYTGSVP